MGTAESILTHSDERAFLGHPKGLFYLAFTEARERFSYYGMTALLVLYMVNQLLLPGHVESVAGFAGFRSAMESLVGPQSPQALASRIFGLYSGFVYFTPMLGGLVADRWIGQRNAVVMGALLMSAGHIAMAFEQSFLLALLLLVTGSGFLKGNISAQVGALYPRKDQVRRAPVVLPFSAPASISGRCRDRCSVVCWRKFMVGISALESRGYSCWRVWRPIYTAIANYRRESLATNSTMAISPLASGGQHLQSERLSRSPFFIRSGSTSSSTCFRSGCSSMLLSKFGGYTIPVPWFNSLEALTSIIVAPLLYLLWNWQASRGVEPSDLSKIGIGAGLSAVNNLILVLANFNSPGALIHPIWPALYAVGTGIAFMYYWPTLLALISRAAPAKVSATMMGIAFLSQFVSNTLIGWIGAFYERMTPIEFWGLHSAIAATGGLVVLIFGRWLTRMLSADAQY